MRLILPTIVASVVAAAHPLDAYAGTFKPISAEPPAVAPTPPEQDQVRASAVVVVRLKGDLAASRLVTRLREEFDTAAANKADLIVLVIEGYRWRADIARALADVVAASKVPVTALLGPSTPLGGGHALVALAASHCWISTLAAIKVEPSDQIPTPVVASIAITPEPSPAPEIATRRKLPAGLATVLLAPTVPMYAMWSDGPEREVTLHEGSPPPKGVAIVVNESGKAVTRISSSQAVRLGIAKATANDPGAVLRGMHVRATSIVTKLVAEDLPARKAELETQLAAVRTLTSQASDRVASAPRGDDPADTDKRRKAGQAAGSTCVRAADALAKAEAIVKQYPELLVEPPPGTSSVGMTPDGSVKAWTAAFKDAQGDLAKAAERAARAAETTR